MSRAKWTLLVYMTADTPYLYAPTERILDQMERAPSSPEVNVVVERIMAIDSSLMQIVHGKRKVLESLPDLNTGRPKYLTEFLDWGVRNYPAEHTAVVIFGHGNGIADTYVVPPDDGRRGEAGTDRPQNHAIGITTTYGDYLTTRGLRKALVDAKKKFDIVGLDACLMGMVEIAYEIRQAAPLFLASQREVHSWQWPYGDILRELVEKPTMQPDALARLIMKAFEGQRTTGTELQSLAMVSLERIDEVRPGFAALSEKLSEMIEEPRGLAELQAIRNRTMQLKTGYLDAMDLVRNLLAIGHDLRALATALGHAVLDVVQTPDDKGRPGGLSLFFPEGTDSDAKERAVYDKLEFARDTGWGRFLSRWSAATKASRRTAAAWTQ